MLSSNTDSLWNTLWWPKSCHAATAHQYQTRGKKETFQRNGVKVTDYGAAKRPEKVKRAC